jgi:bacillolysin
MNEGFSDIWGACVEYYAAPTKQTWLIGEDIERRTGHVSLRSMSNPNVEAQPDTYGGTYWKTVNCTPTSTNDYCGVHTNSGVLNHWFYILTVGKVGTNDLGNAFSVTGIGIDKAAKIAFRTESVYLTSNSTYANARTYGIQAAKDLYGANSAEVIATTNAFYAVGLGAAYSGPTDNTAPTAPTNLVASGTTENSTNLSWSASTDNVGVTSYLVYQGSTQIGSTASTSFAVTGLLASTSYSFTVKAKDAAGNLSAVSNTATITTQTPAPDTLAPTAPVLSTSSTTTSSTVLSWSGATDNVGIVAYDVYMGATLLGSITATTYTSLGLTASTTYTYYVVAKDAAGNSSVSSNVVSVTTLTPVVYCNSIATNTTREKINKVTFGTINNTSTGASGYENFTNISTYAVPGTSYAITIKPAWTSTKYKEGYAVFIDFNGNGLFSDAGETVFVKAPTNSGSVSGTISIPATATLGSTRMRVSMKNNAIPTACETFTYGQVEDYTVTIALTSNGLDSISAQGFAMNTLSNSSEFDVAIFPNPVENNLHIRTSDKNVTYHVMNYLGQEVKHGLLEDDSIDVSVLEPGIYFLNIHSNQQVISKKFIKK